MQTITPAATRHDPSGKFIDNHRIGAAHNVVDIVNEKLLGLKSIVDKMSPGILRIK